MRDERVPLRSLVCGAKMATALFQFSLGFYAAQHLRLQLRQIEAVAFLDAFVVLAKLADRLFIAPLDYGATCRKAAFV